MLKTQENKLSMYEAVNSYLETNSGVYSGIAELMEMKGEFVLNKVKLSRKEDERINAKIGKVEEKSTARESVTMPALAISGAIFAYAKKTGDPELQKKSDITISDLDRIRDSEFPIALNSIKDLASANLSNLSGFGINEEMVTNFGSRIERYAKALGSKESSGATKKGASDSLEKLFRSGDSILESIDRMLERYREENPEFYNGYKKSRQIIYTGVRHRKEEPAKNPAQ